jgi:hypothetical protein
MELRDRDSIEEAEAKRVEVEVCESSATEDCSEEMLGERFFKAGW